MKNPKTYAAPVTILAGLLAATIMGSVLADECTKNCAADLKACRKQVDIATSQESHPLLTDSSARRANKGQESAFDQSSGMANSQNDEIHKRVDERYRECATGNGNCLAACSSGSAKPKISVILK